LFRAPAEPSKTYVWSIAYSSFGEEGKSFLGGKGLGGEEVRGES
jgi:hypothetical protein